MASTIKVDKIAQASGTPAFTIPTADGSVGQFLKTDGNGVLSFDTVTTNPLSLTGSTNTWIPTITAANALTGTANFTYDGTTLGVKNSGTASDIKVYCETANTHYTSIKSAAHAAYTGGSWTMTLPGTDGAASQFLQTNGSGVTTWATPTAGLYESWALITDEKAQNAYGQSVVGGAWRTRDVQTEVYDTDNIVTIASNQFTIGPGTFLIIAHPLEQGGNAAQYRIYDATNSAQVQLGLSIYSDNGTNRGTRDANIFGRVVIASGTVTYEVQVYNASGTTNSTNPSNVPGTTEHYMFVEIYKLN